MQTLKRLLLTSYCITVLVLSVSSQPATSCFLSNSFCNYNLSDTSTSLPYNTVGKDLGINYGKYDTSAYPGDVRYQIENDGCTAGSTSCTKINTGVLHYDVYYPVVANGSQCLFPVIFNVHGGGFSDCKVLGAGGGNSDGIAYAKRGFIFIDIEYRNGRRVTPSKAKFNYTTVQQQLASYRALQDVTGAIRTAILFERQELAKTASQRKPYQIDTNYIFLAGNSAGAITALGVAYYSRQSMVDSLNPYQGNFSISQALGPVNADYYQGGTDIEFRSKIKGVLAQWGSLSVPYGYDTSTAKNFFDQRIPVICFHGLQDSVVNPNIAPINFAPVDMNPATNYGNTYNIENTCLLTNSFKTNGNTLPGPDNYMYGSLSYFKYVLVPLGIRREEYVDCDAGHGLDPDDSTFKSDYGIGNPTTDYSTVSAVKLYIDGRGATFFQNIIGNSSPPTHRIFFECRNNRTTCYQANNDAGCMNTDGCGSHPHQ